MSAVGIPGGRIPQARWARTAAQAVNGLPRGSSLTAQTITTEGGTFTADSFGRKALTPSVVVRRGTVTLTINVNAGNGSNAISIMRNGSLVGSTAIPSGGSWNHSITARDGDLVQGYMTNAPGNFIGLSTAGGNSLAYRGDLDGRLVTVAIPAKAYNVPSVAPLIVPITNAVRCSAGYATALLQVASGNGSNAVAIYVNGVVAKTVNVGSTGPLSVVWMCSSGDIVQFFNTNSAGNGMTLTASTFTYQRA